MESERGSHVSRRMADWGCCLIVWLVRRFTVQSTRVSHHLRLLRQLTPAPRCVVVICSTQIMDRSVDCIWETQSMAESITRIGLVCNYRQGNYKQEESWATHRHHKTLVER